MRVLVFCWLGATKRTEEIHKLPPKKDGHIFRLPARKWEGDQNVRDVAVESAPSPASRPSSPSLNLGPARIQVERAKVLMTRISNKTRRVIISRTNKKNGQNRTNNSHLMGIIKNTHKVITGCITILHQPEIRWLGGIPHKINSPFGVRSCEVVIIHPDS